ncbi:TELO2-interacting protein 2-like [Ornithodoros turicata]|uniref:TELO2-interacting protein 2-like n=1 Tax=Ornithodoros turicata TaxID=34597 RepID=UPI003139AD2B
MDIIKRLQNGTSLPEKRLIIDDVTSKAAAFATDIAADDTISEKFATALLSSGVPITSERDEERECEREDFPHLPETASSALTCAAMVLEHSCTLRKNRRCTVPLSVLSYAHLNPSLPWCDETSVTRSKELLKLIKGTASPGDIPVGVIHYIQAHLRKDTWKKNPCYRHIFKAAMSEIHLPNLYSHIDVVFPPALLLVDDYMTHNQLLGLMCVKHILTNVAPTELEWRGRHEVIYDALKHLLYIREAPVIHALYDCLHRFLFSSDVQSVSLLRAHEEHGLREKSEEVFREMLRGAEAEQKIVIREAYSRHLAPYILGMGVGVLKYLQTTLRVVLDYIDVYDTAEQTCRRNALVALQALVKVAWPVIGSRFDEVVKALFRLAYDLDERGCDVMDDELRRCLKVLKDACPEEHKNFVGELSGLKEENIPGVERLLSCLD